MTSTENELSCTVTPRLSDSAGPALLGDPTFHAEGDPHALWRHMRTASPVYHHPPGALPEFWSLTKYADIRSAYRDPLTFSSARGVLLREPGAGDDPGGGQTLALTDPPRHKQLRAVVSQWFTERAARAIEPAIACAVRRLVAGVVERGGCEFVHDVAARLSIYVICDLLGVPEPDHEKVFIWTDEAYREHRPLATQHELMEYVGELIYQRMEQPADDIVSALANGTPNGELLTEQEILLNCENLIGATENGRLAMAGGMHELATRPDQWARLRDDPALIPSAVEEILRYTSSATHSLRRTTRAVELGGKEIAAESWVALWVPSANRDEDVFTDAGQFNIARTPNRHLALGIGEHFCLGSTMARTQLRILLTALLDRVPHLDVIGEVTRVRSVAVSGPVALNLQLSA